MISRVELISSQPSVYCRLPAVRAVFVQSAGLGMYTSHSSTHSGSECSFGLYLWERVGEGGRPRSRSIFSLLCCCPYVRTIPRLFCFGMRTYYTASITKTTRGVLIQYDIIRDRIYSLLLHASKIFQIRGDDNPLKPGTAAATS